MQAVTDSSYKTDEKKELTPEEFARAKTVCEFVIDLTKAISRSGYYDAHHPVSMEVKKGLYDAFKNALGDSPEIMLTCHESDEKVDIHILGILNEPFNIRKLTHANTSDLFVPKLKDYFERKSLNSFVIKRYITPEHFESFIDIMSEPVADTADSSQLGDHLTKALADLDITEVSTVFKNDIVLPRGKLPWRVSIILRRLAKDLKIVPMFRSASADKMKEIKKQIVEDIIRPLNNPELLKDLIVNCDIIVTYLTHLMEMDELENLLVNSLPEDEVVEVTREILDIYRECKVESKVDENDSSLQEREAYLSKVLTIAAKRIIDEILPDSMNLLESLYENKIVGFRFLPVKLRLIIENRKLAGEVIAHADEYIERTSQASSREDMESLVVKFQAAMPEFIRKKEWRVIGGITKALNDLSIRREALAVESDLLSDLPDFVFEGSEAILADQYIQANVDEKIRINEAILEMKSGIAKIADAVSAKSKDPEVLKSLMNLLVKKGEIAEAWAIKILNDQSQPLSMLNIALLLIMNVGNERDVQPVKRYIKYPNASIRTKALNAMVKLSKKEAEEMALEALKDEEEKVSSQAAYLIERELSLSRESVDKLLIFLKSRLQKKTMSLSEAGMLATLIRSIGKYADPSNKESLEKEITAIASDLLKERTGLMKFIKAELSPEHLEIACACAAALAKTGSERSRDFLKSISRLDAALSKTAGEALAELDKRTAGR